jgi:hypothetical protein
MVLRMGIWCGSMWAGGIHQGRPRLMITRQPLVVLPMVVAAQQAQVLQVGTSAVGPGADVMGLGPAGWGVAAREAAAFVAGGEGVALSRAGGAAGLSVAKDAGVVEDYGDQVGLPGQSERLGGGESAAVGGGHHSGALFELIDGHGHEHGGRGATGWGEVIAGQQQGGGVREGVVEALSRCAAVRTVRVGGVRCGERVEHRLPLG